MSSNARLYIRSVKNLLVHSNLMVIAIRKIVNFFKVAPDLLGAGKITDSDIAHTRNFLKITTAADDNIISSSVENKINFFR